MSETEYSNRALAEALGYTVKNHAGTYALFSPSGERVERGWSDEGAWFAYNRGCPFDTDANVIIKELHDYCLDNSLVWNSYTFMNDESTLMYRVQIWPRQLCLEYVESPKCHTFAEAAAMALWEAIQNADKLKINTTAYHAMMRPFPANMQKPDKLKPVQHKENDDPESTS